MFFDFIETVANKPKFLFTKKIINMFRKIKVGYSEGLPILVGNDNNIIASSTNKDYCIFFLKEHIKSLKSKNIPFIIITFGNLSGDDLLDLMIEYNLSVVTSSYNDSVKKKQIVIDSSDFFDIIHIIQRHRVFHHNQRLVMFNFDKSIFDLFDRIFSVYRKYIYFSIINSNTNNLKNNMINFDDFYFISLDSNMLHFSAVNHKDILVDFIKSGDYAYASYELK